MAIWHKPCYAKRGNCKCRLRSGFVHRHRIDVLRWMVE